MTARRPHRIVHQPSPTDESMLAAETKAWVEYKFQKGLSLVQAKVHDALVSGAVKTAAELDAMLGGRHYWLTYRDHEHPTSCDACDAEDGELVDLFTGCHDDYGHEETIRLCRRCVADALAAFPPPRS